MLAHRMELIEYLDYCSRRAVHLGRLQYPTSSVMSTQIILDEFVMVHRGATLKDKRCKYNKRGNCRPVNLNVSTDTRETY